jgi:hypothetical protein
MTILAHEAGAAATGPRRWWEQRLFVVLLMAVATVPLLYPAIPPLVDIFGHMGRYRVQLDLAQSPALQQFYGFAWAPIGNLGVDVLVQALGPLVGLEPAVKLIVATIPALTVAGFLWVAREVHHRLPPTAIFALPLAYSFPFLFGFANFTLAMALAMLAFALWLRLGERDRGGVRAILFVPISIVIFFTHAFGWGTLGLLCFSAEAVRQHDRGARWFAAAWKAALHASVMALPILFMLMWRSGQSVQMTYGWFDWGRKWEWVYSALRDRWQWFDVGTVAVLGLVLIFAAVHRRLEYSRNLAFSVLVLLGAFLILPWTIFGSAYADMRIFPYLLALALLAIRFKGPTPYGFGRTIALVALALFGLRLAGTTASLAIAARDQQARLQALGHVPIGARLVHFSGLRCGNAWPLPRNSHLGAMAIVRRQAFSNDQWAIEGANLLSVHYPQGSPFLADSSQMVRPNDCDHGVVLPVDRAMAIVPRQAFDFIWLIDAEPSDPRALTGLRPVWRGPGSLLYAVQKPGGNHRP